MGIDARILVRIKQDHRPTDEQLARWSWHLCQSVGASKFFTNDGLPYAEYKAASQKWHADFNAHPLYPQYQAGGDARTSVHRKILDDLGAYPQELRRAIRLSPDYADNEEEKVGDGKAYYQDGETLFAADGEWFLQVSLWTRFYGIGYERGDLMTILAVAAWLEFNIPGCEVWYGGDSSGCEAGPLTQELKEKLLRHLMSQSGRDYFNHGRHETYPTPKPCGLCIPGEPHFNRFGWGLQYVAVECGGCGKSFVSQDDGKTWALKEEQSTA